MNKLRLKQIINEAEGEQYPYYSLLTEIIDNYTSECEKVLININTEEKSEEMPEEASEELHRLTTEFLASLEKLQNFYDQMSNKIPDNEKTKIKKYLTTSWNAAKKFVGLVGKGVKLTKKFWGVLDKYFKVFGKTLNVTNSKVGQDITKALAYSNPITGGVYKALKGE